jgi:hypothetical protein
MSVSGAAASPNMGYNSSGPVTFLMTLFNARLGAWLSNPGRCGDKSYSAPYPRFSHLALIRELFGMTDDTSPYVYLSDGGHFENLGLYEMVLRRCRYIVVVDAGHDPKCTFGDLGNTVRKVRIDLGVPIEFNEVNIFPVSDNEAQNQKGVYCAVGTIKYSVVDGDEADVAGKLGGSNGNGKDGKLLYVKPAFYAQHEPRDVYEYAKRNPEFPHESTVDQWFSESQFESYRALGHHIFEDISKDICPAGSDNTIEGPFAGIEDKLKAKDEQVLRNLKALFLVKCL